MSKEENNGACLTVVNEALKDKVVQVGNKSLPLTDVYLGCVSKFKGIKTDTTSFENMMAYVLDKFADNRYKEPAMNTWLKIIDSPIFDFNHLVNFMFKPTSYLNRNNRTSYKHNLPRTEVMNKILEKLDTYAN